MIKKLIFIWLLSAQFCYAATLTKGKTFSSDEEVTNTKLHNLIDNGTIADITQTDIKAAEGIVLRDTTSPSDVDQLWTDTTFTVPVLRLSDGTNWQAASPCIPRLTNGSGGQLDAGDIVVVDTSADSSFTTTTTASDDDVLGVLIETINTASAGLVAVCGGPFTVKVTGTVDRGDYLITTTTATRAGQAVSLEDGVIGQALTANASGLGTVEAILRTR